MSRSLKIAIVVLSLACGRATEKAETKAPKPGAAPSAAAPAQTSTVIDVGSVMPSYAAPYLDGKTFEMNDQRGKVVFLNLWATWCGPCRFEIPDLQKLHDSYAAKGFEVVGVSVDEGEAKVVSDFVAEQKMTYPVVHDADGKLAVLLDTSILPTSILVDRSGKVVWKKLGLVTTTDRELISALEKALAAKG